MKYMAIILWAFLFFYLSNAFDVPKNILYIFLGFPILLGGVFFIRYLFERENDGKR